MKITEQMDVNRKYTEKETNEIIRLHIAFSDIALIRREIFQYKLIGRLRDDIKQYPEGYPDQRTGKALWTQVQKLRQMPPLQYRS